MAERLKTVFGHLSCSSGGFLGANNVGAEASPASNHNFKYTLDGPMLSMQQRQFYEENGFIVIKKLVPLSNIEEYRNRFVQICKREVKVPMLTIMRDIAIKDSEFVAGEKAVTKIQDFAGDDEMFKYCALPEVVDYIESFIGPNVVAMHTMLINKPPDSGKKTSRHPMHQDLYYFPFRPAERIVCSWTAMQKINRDNGCLVVVPGTHKGKLIKHEYPDWEGGVNKMYHGIQTNSGVEKRVHLDMEAGDTVFFHPLLIHGSGTNKTKDFRKAISCHYASGDCFYLDEIEPEQQLIADEVKELLEKRFGKDIEADMSTAWKMKSRVVRGTDSFN